ncbi:kelch-like protein diablo [Tigriopus californicus]|nr:kelch-like protein diablo [Tigriopus californicus]
MNALGPPLGGAPALLAGLVGVSDMSGPHLANPHHGHDLMSSCGVVGGSSSLISGANGGGLDGRPASPARLAYSSEKHTRSAFNELHAIRKHNDLCDVVIHVGNRKIYAHKVILAACSPYFRAMFTGELAESRQTEVTIRDVEETAMEILVDFCYSAKIVVEEANVQTLLPAACLLQLQEIQDVCCVFLKRQLDPSNCLGIRAFADTHACRELLRVADKFTYHNFQEVIEHEEFLLLPLSQLIEICSSDELNVRTEEQVYQAIMTWVKYNIVERRQHLPVILQHVRLPLLSPKFLVGTVGADVLIKSDEACRDLVDEAKNYLLLPQERPHMQGPRTRPRKPTRRGEVLFAVGGWCSGDAIASVERYDPQSGDWKMVAAMSKRRCGVGVAVLNDLLYAVGGHDGQSYLNSIERYDPQTNQWSADVAPTSSCRTSVGVAVLDGYLYAVGGQDGVSCLNHVERYDPKENKWNKVASMMTRRLGVAVAVLNGYLYAIGGSDGQCPLNTVERYDPRKNTWTAMAPMSTRRKHLGCAVFNNMIYAVGGRDDTTELSSAERYNPSTNTWSPIVAMMSRRSGVGLAVVNGQLYAVGGFDGTTYLKTIEVFDQDANNWKLCGSMNYRRLGGGVGVVRMPHTDSHFW